MKPQQNQLESASRAQQRLEAAGIASALIGGLAVAVWGEPRVTKDVDLRVLLSRDKAELLIAALSPDFTFGEGDPIAKLQQSGFIITYDATGVRVDFLLADLGFDRIIVERASHTEPIANWPIKICSPEDLIISKLITLRPRDEEDARLVIRRQHKNLDDAHIEYWLQSFEQILDDSTIVNHYRQLRQRYS